MADQAVAPPPRRCIVAGCGGPLRDLVLPGGATGLICEWCEDRVVKQRLISAIQLGAIASYRDEAKVARVVMDLQRQVQLLSAALEEAQSERAQLAVRAAQSLSPVEHQVLRVLPDVRELALSNKGIRARIPGVTKGGIRKALLLLEERRLVACVLNPARQSRQDDWSRYYRTEPLAGAKRSKAKDQSAIEQYGLPIEGVMP